MYRFSQKELIREGFLDAVRGFAAVAKDINRKIAPKTMASIDSIKDTVKKFRGQVPKQLVKDYLKENRATFRNFKVLEEEQDKERDITWVKFSAEAKLGSSTDKFEPVKEYYMLTIKKRDGYHLSNNIYDVNKKVIKSKSKSKPNLDEIVASIGSNITPRSLAISLINNSKLNNRSVRIVSNGEANDALELLTLITQKGEDDVLNNSDINLIRNNLYQFVESKKSCKKVLKQLQLLSR